MKQIRILKPHQIMTSFHREQRNYFQCQIDCNFSHWTSVACLCSSSYYFQNNVSNSHLRNGLFCSAKQHIHFAFQLFFSEEQTQPVKHNSQLYHKDSMIARDYGIRLTSLALATSEAVCSVSEVLHKPNYSVN